MCTGSFLGMMIYRLPIMLYRPELIQKKSFNLIYPFSFCPKCKTRLYFWQMLPLISYLFLRGKCYFCHEKISLHYFFIESLTLLATIILLLKIDLSWQLIFSLILTWSLLILAFIDLKTFLLPNQITLPTLALGLIINSQNIMVPFYDALFGALSGYLLFALLAWLIGKIRKHEVLGGGDFKLIALLGAWLGWQVLPMLILISSISGLVVGLSYILVQNKTFNTKIPFGPFLSLAGFLMLVWGKEILYYQQYYVQLFL